jgi:hypothetical protein
VKPVILSTTRRPITTLDHQGIFCTNERLLIFTLKILINQNPIPKLLKPLTKTQISTLYPEAVSLISYKLRAPNRIS